MLTATAGATETVHSVLPEEMRETCREATNGCQICVVLAPSRVVHCSLPGIACQPKAWTCRVPEGAAPADPKTK